MGSRQPCSTGYPGQEEKENFATQGGYGVYQLNFFAWDNQQDNAVTRGQTEVDLGDPAGHGKSTGEWGLHSSRSWLQPASMQTHTASVKSFPSTAYDSMRAARSRSRSSLTKCGSSSRVTQACSSHPEPAFSCTSQGSPTTCMCTQAEQWVGKGSCCMRAQ